MCVTWVGSKDDAQQKSFLKKVKIAYIESNDKDGKYIFPVQAKGGRDRMSLVQIEQDIALCAEKFPRLVCRPLGAQFLPDRGIALFEFIHTEDGLRLAAEKHYLLVPRDGISDDDLDKYRNACGPDC